MSGIRFTKLDIVLDAICKEKNILKDHADIREQAIQLIFRMSVPPSLMHPSSTSQKRVIKLHNVVLPEPDGPTIAVVVLAGIVRLTWFKIR